MAKKKKGFKKIRKTTDIISIEGLLQLDKLVGFSVDVEEEGLKDFSNDIKELNGENVKITITVVDEIDCTEDGFPKIESSDEE